LPSLIIGDWAKEVQVSQAGNYPDCEICHYKAAYDEEAQSLNKGSGQNTPTNIQMVAALDDIRAVVFGRGDSVTKVQKVQDLITRLNTGKRK